MTNVLENKNAGAFTLAEVLITLGVIGVVSAITMPTLIKNYQKQQTVTQFKKAYTEINQAIKLSEVENGDMSGWHVENDLQTQHDWAKNYIIKYFKTAKVCVPATEECYDAKFSEATAKYFSFITVSGYSIMGWTHDGGNGGWLHLDINGPKKGPNKTGKDRFTFILQFDNDTNINGKETNKVVDKAGIYLLGLGLSPALTRDELINGGENLPGGLANYRCNEENKGFCGALIVTDGWKISDDYPW